MARKSKAGLDLPPYDNDEDVPLSVKYPAVPIHNPHQFEQVVQNLRNMHAATPDPLKEEGRVWYPKVNDAVAKGVRGMGLGRGGDAHLAGSGLVAALSPGMDFDRSNIQAFNELKHIKSADWDVLMKHGRFKESGEEGGPQQKRHPAVAHMLQGLEIAKAPDVQLYKAHRIMRGEDPEAVLNRRTAPKTNSFMHNIHDPSSNQFVTIDGRAHDIGNNRMYPWTYSGRGISSAVSAPYSSGRPRPLTRYEHFQDAHKMAAEMEGEDTGNAFQAITWVGGKHRERAMSGRAKGPARRGQPYL